MKQISFLLATILMSLSLLAQTPQGINYQTVIRDNDGNPMPYTDIWLRVSIVNGMTSGDLLYAEVHPETTNGFGLVNLVIGQGSPLTGIFEDINWQHGELYLETAFNLDGGNDYQVLGVTELLTVPFAKYADFAGGMKSMTTAERDELQNLSTGYAIYNITTNCLNYWNGSNWFETCGECTPQPSQAVAGDDQYFSDETTATNLQGNQPESGMGTWSVVSGSGGTFDDANDPETLFTGLACTQYELTWMILTDCHASIASTTVTFFHTPTQADAGEDQLGLTGTWTTLAANSPEQGNGQWSILSGEGGTLTNPANPTTTLLGQNLQHYVLKWEIITECHTSADTVNVVFGFMPFMSCGDLLIDTRDGQSYTTVQIGTQCWMVENLQYLPAVAGLGTWSNTVPYYYVYDYNGTDVTAAKATANYQGYGVLYNWPASLEACPEGWYLPTDEQWDKLADYMVAQGYPNQGDNPNGAGNALKSCQQENSPLGGDCNTSVHPRWDAHSIHHGFDEFGGSVLPGGAYVSDSFNGLGSSGKWWSATEKNSVDAWNYYILGTKGSVLRIFNYKSLGFSVRCLRN
jgi:uncharacterized protein (TIGR02145 family)